MNWNLLHVHPEAPKQQSGSEKKLEVSEGGWVPCEQQKSMGGLPKPSLPPSFPEALLAGPHLLPGLSLSPAPCSPRSPSTH